MEDGPRTTTHVGDPDGISGSWLQVCKDIAMSAAIWKVNQFMKASAHSLINKY